MAARLPDGKVERPYVRPIAFGFAGVALLVHLLTNTHYGYFRDELYFIACARHLDWGYVDHAPLSIWLLRLQMLLFGDSLFALRLFPALASALTVALSGFLAREMGGKSWATGLACAAALAAPVYLAMGNFYSLNVYEPLFWMGAVYILLRILNGASSRHWLSFGLIVGLGLENKHSIAFFAVGLVLALLFTSHRRHFAARWIWLGGFVAFLVALPNLLWQIAHRWPTLELLSNVARSNKNVVLSPIEFLAQQILILNPATLPLWLGGLAWLCLAKDGRRYRLLGFAYLITLAIFILLKGKHYYLAPIYPMLFAAGAVGCERLFAVRLRWLRPAFAATMLTTSAVLAPTILPILPPEKLVAYMRAIHFEPPRTETSHTAALPQLFADQFGWEEMVRSVARAFAQLSPEDQKRVAIFCQNYGEAGAIDFFGSRYGLPPALSGHQHYFFWGPRGYDGDLVLVIDGPHTEVYEDFASVEDLGPVDSSPWAMPWQQRRRIYLCRQLKVPLAEAWPAVKEWL